MKRAVPIVLLVVALATAGCAALPAPCALAATPSSQVTIVLAPYLTWSEVTPETTPVLWRLAGSGAVGSVGARSRVPEASEPPSPLEGALTLSAGNWATPDYTALPAFNATEMVGPVTAADVYRGQAGHAMGAAAIAYLGLPGAEKANASSADTALGTLGGAVRHAGGKTLAVGNSDAVDVAGAADATGVPKLMRPAGVAAMDTGGLVDFGDVSPDLLRPASGAPYGVVTDVAVLASRLASARSEVPTATGPVLVVVDPGDAYRARRFAWRVTSDVARAQRTAALAELDRVVGVAQAQLPRGGVLIVVTQGLLYDTFGKPQGFGPVIISGGGWHGYLTSNSTHRSGLATELDVTATALQILGLERPVQVAGNPLIAVSTPSAALDRVTYLRQLDRTALALDSWHARVIDAFLVLTGVAFGLAALVLALRGRLSRRVVGLCAGIDRILVLFVVSVPVASWLLFLVSPRPDSGATATALMCVIALVLALIAGALGGRLGSRFAPAALALLTVTVLLVDQWVGAPLSYTNFFGYSPLGSARFYGMGNEAAALCLGAALVGTGLVLDQWTRETWAPLARRFGVAALGVLVVVTASAPFFGANFGVAIWGTFGFVVAWVLMNGRRLSWKTVVVAVLFVALLIGAFAAVDLLGHGEQTHLGRSLVTAGQGGIAQLWLIVARKAQTNARVLSHTDWSWLLIETLALLAVLRIGFRERFLRLFSENPQFARAMFAAAVTGVLAFFTEDSGIVIPSLVSLYVGVGLAWLMLMAATEGENS